MSYQVFFDFSLGLAQRLRVPAGTKKAIIAHVEEVESVLGLKRTQYENNAIHWDNFDPEFMNGFPSVDNEVLCNTVLEHNAWVRGCYRDFADWSEKPFKSSKGHTGEWITPKDAKKFWHGFQRLEVGASRWTPDYYIDRMEHLYEVMRGRESEGVTFGEKALTTKQAAQVINLFSTFLDHADRRLDVPNGYDYLASSYDGGYDWCEKCGPVHPDDADACRKRKCPIRAERGE
jgi:ribosomal protein L40E